MTKIDIISGFLGAGKTTLIKKLIKEAFEGQKIVLIENEFGEIGIDGGFLKEAGIEITEMNSGCICCSLVGDFGTALKEVLTTYTPDRVIIEPSGVGKLSDVIKAVEDVANDIEVELNTFTAVVDATKSKMYMKNFGEFFNNQIENAKTIILSRTQNIQDDKLEKCVHDIKEHNANAVIITTPWDSLTGEAILNAMEQSKTFEKQTLEELEHEHHHHHEHGEECCCGHHHDEEHEHHHHHEHDEECCCGHHHDEEHEHHHHEHDEECCCGHHHDEEHGHHHHHEHDEECCCGHHHDEEHEHHHHEHDEHCGCGHHHHHADDVFTSWGVETPHKYSEDDIRSILEKLTADDTYGTILRAKGIVASTDGRWIHFDMVPGEFEVRFGDADYTGKLCVIGAQLDKNGLNELFDVVGA